MFALSLTSINFHLSTVLVAFISQQGEEKNYTQKYTYTSFIYTYAITFIRVNLFF